MQDSRIFQKVNNLTTLIPIQLMIATHPWVKTRRESLQLLEPQRELFMGETPKTTLAPQHAGS
ncbi:MAG: hypothetical protein RM338_20220 [Nostoc sp. DedQUE12a]|nr:hypothetical protein [Nostoc sp. DedQUE12a]